jgi:hypothetical protein
MRTGHSPRGRRGVQKIAHTGPRRPNDHPRFPKCDPRRPLVARARHDDGTLACKPLTHHPQFLKWKDEFRPGEMWSFFGEKWVTEEEAKKKWKRMSQKA